MPIHKEVMRLYKKYYGSDVAVGVDKHFLKEISILIDSFEKTLERFVHGNNQIE